MSVCEGTPSMKAVGCFIQQFLLDLVGVTTDQVYFDIGMSFPETGQVFG